MISTGRDTAGQVQSATAHRELRAAAAGLSSEAPPPLPVVESPRCLRASPFRHCTPASSGPDPRARTPTASIRPGASANIGVADKQLWSGALAVPEPMTSSRKAWFYELFRYLSVKVIGERIADEIGQWQDDRASGLFDLDHDRALAPMEVVEVQGGDVADP